MVRSATIADFTERVVAIPLLSQPGTTWHYGVSVDVLGRIVEVASGKTFDRYLQDEIFGPLGMRETGFHVSPQTGNRVIPLYDLRDGRLEVPAEPIAPHYQPESRLFMGGEGLLSTVPDYLRFGQMLLNGGALDGRRILRRETVSMMLANHVDPSMFASVSDVAHGWLPEGTYGFGYGGAVRLDSAANAAPRARTDGQEQRRRSFGSIRETTSWR
jgi:CubicO group peptidase (beta-lactamase class C family)